MKLKLFLSDIAYWSGWNVISILPEWFGRIIFKWFADFAWRRRTTRIRQLELNLSRATGLPNGSDQIRQLSRKTVRSYLRYYFEIFLLPRWTNEQIQNKVIVKNLEPVDAALKNGGIIIALPHMGNWDLAGAWAANHFGQLCTVAERLRPEGVFQKFLKMRRKIGITLIPLEGDGNPYEFLKTNLKQGMPIALLADRDVSGTGLTNYFFGVPTKTPLGPALLSIETKLPIFTCATWYEGDKLIIEFDSQIVFPTQELNSEQQSSSRASIRRAQELSAIILQRFEKHIQAHPESWYQMQPIWSDLKVDA